MLAPWTLLSGTPSAFRYGHRHGDVMTCKRFSHYRSVHYNDVIMGVMASQITSLTIVRLFMGKSKKTSKLRVTGFCEGNSPVTGEFPAQMASNAENVYIWWRHHVWFGGSCSNVELRCFCCCPPKQTLRQTGELTAMWNVMTFSWYHCDGNQP